MRGAFSMVAAWIETTAGSTAAARSAKLGRPRVVLAVCAATWVAESVRSGSVDPGTVIPRPPARTMPKTTAPTTRSMVATWRLRVMLMSTAFSFLLAACDLRIAAHTPYKQGPCQRNFTLRPEEEPGRHPLEFGRTCHLGTPEIKTRRAALPPT